MFLFAELLMGIAFTLVGLKLFTSYYNQLETTPLHHLIGRWTPNAFLASLWGGVISLAMLGNPSATTCIAAGFRSVGVSSLENTSHMVLFSWVGACLLLFFSGLDINTFLFTLTGLAGIWFATEWPKRGWVAASMVFGFGLFYNGCQAFQEATMKMMQEASVQAWSQFFQVYPLACLGFGFLVLLGTQNFFASLVIIAGVFASGFLAFEQAYLSGLGVLLGQAFVGCFYAKVLGDSFRVAMRILCLNMAFAFCLGMADYVLEHYFQVSGIAAFASDLTSHSLQSFPLALVMLLSVSSVVGSFCLPAVCRRLMTCEYKEEGNLTMQMADIPVALLNDPEITLEILAKKENHLLKQQTAYFDLLRSKEIASMEKRHRALAQDYNTLKQVYQTLLEKQKVSEPMGERIMLGLEFHHLAASLEENLHEFSMLSGELATEFRKDPEGVPFLDSLAESLDAILVTFVDVAHAPETGSLKMVEKITTEREDFSGFMRERFPATATPMQQMKAMKVTHLFESSIWIFRRMAQILGLRMEDSALY